MLPKSLQPTHIHRSGRLHVTSECFCNTICVWPPRLRQFEVESPLVWNIFFPIIFIIRYNLGRPVWSPSPAYRLSASIRAANMLSTALEWDRASSLFSRWHGDGDCPATTLLDWESIDTGLLIISLTCAVVASSTNGVLFFRKQRLEDWGSGALAQRSTYTVAFV